MVRFYIPETARWSSTRQKTTGLGEYLTDAFRAVAVYRELLELDEAHLVRRDLPSVVSAEPSRCGFRDYRG